MGTRCHRLEIKFNTLLLLFRRDAFFLEHITVVKEVFILQNFFFQWVLNPTAANHPAQVGTLVTFEKILNPILATICPSEIGTICPLLVMNSRVGKFKSWRGLLQVKHTL